MKIGTGRIIDFMGYLGLAFMWIWLGTMYSGLPGRIPIHFDLRGRPDNYGHKLTVLILPLVATILFVMLNRSAKNRIAGKLQAVGVVIAMAILLVKSIHVALGNAETIGPFFLPLAIGLVFFPGIAYAFSATKK